MGAPITSTSFAKALWPGVNSWYGKAYDEYPTEWTSLFNQESSNRAYEEDVGITSFGLAQRKPEGQSIAFDEESQAYITRYAHVVYALGFIVTREIFEDDLYDVVAQRRARGLAYSMRQTKEVVGANVYNRAFNNAYVGGDGVEMISALHPNFAGGTQSNIQATPAALSEASIEEACIQIAKWENDRGLRIAVQPESLIIPVDLMFEAERIIYSPYRTAGDTNDISAIYRMGKFKNGVVVNHYLTDPTAYFMRTGVGDSLKAFSRRGMEFAIDNDFDTENAKFKASERYSFGWTDWRGIWGSPGA
jgi:hypothetical protein